MDGGGGGGGCGPEPHQQERARTSFPMSAFIATRHESLGRGLMTPMQVLPPYHPIGCVSQLSFCEQNRETPIHRSNVTLDDVDRGFPVPHNSFPRLSDKPFRPAKTSASKREKQAVGTRYVCLAASCKGGPRSHNLGVATTTTNDVETCSSTAHLS